MFLKKQKISILFIIGSTHAGGVPSFILNLVKNLDKKIFCNIELVAPPDGRYFKVFNSLITVHNKRIRGCYPETLFFLRTLIKKRHFDIVYANGRGAGIYGRLAAIGTGAKTVYSYHGFNYDHFSGVKKIIYRGFEKMMLNWTDKVVCVSESEKARAIKANLLIEKKAALIPNGIDFEALRTRQATKNGYIIGVLAKTCIQKGLEYLIPAVALLKENYPDVRCFIAGKTLPEEFSREAHIRKAIKVSGLDNVVVLLGDVLDIEWFFNAIDLYVSAALWEGLPTAILEAFAYRVPVVATEVAGNKDLVVHKKTGILVQPKSSRSLAEGIDFAFENRGQMKTFAENAYQYGRRHYSLQTMVKNHQKLYQNLVNPTLTTND